MPVPLFRLLAVGAHLLAVPPVFAHQDDAADRFAAEVPAYQFHATGDDKRKPAVVYTFVAVNHIAQKVLIHFLYHSDADIWGVVCAPVCSSEQVFKVYRREQ